jgi:hypothetical protein
MDIAAGGEFWLPETPDVTVRGAFRVDPGEQPEARLAAALVEDPRVTRSATGGLTYAQGPAGSIKASLPLTIQSQLLDSGESVTLVNAQNWGGPGPPFGVAQYKAHYAIVGDRHVSGSKQLFSAMRFRFGASYWLGHLRDGETGAVDGDGSTLSVEAAEDGNWLLYTPAAPMTLQRLESMVILGCLTLAELALDQDFDARDTQVRVNAGDAWLAVHGSGANTPPKEFSYRTLLPREELTIERFAKWIPLNDTLDGLARVAARPIDGLLQTQVLVATSLLEGIHRRLPLRQSKFPNASQKAIERTKQAVRRGAKDQAAGEKNLPPGEVHKSVKDAVGHFDDVDYFERARDVVNKVCAVLPEIAESVGKDDLANYIKNARNEMAHQSPLDHQKEPLDVRYLRWLVVAEVMPWLLRGLLLLEVGIDPGLMHDWHLMDRRFPSFRANVAQFVSELGWQLPSPGD